MNIPNHEIGITVGEGVGGRSVRKRGIKALKKSFAIF